MTDAPASKSRLRISSLAVLLPYMRPYFWRSLAAAATLLIAAGLVLALGQGVRRLIDMGFASGSMASLNRAALAMSAVIIALAFATAGHFAHHGLAGAAAGCAAGHYASRYRRGYYHRSYRRAY